MLHGIILVSVLYKTEGQICTCLLPPLCILNGHKTHQFLFLCFSPVANYYEEFFKKKRKADEVHILLEFTSREACWSSVMDRVYHEVSSRQKYP